MKPGVYKVEWRLIYFPTPYLRVKFDILRKVGNRGNKNGEMEKGRGNIRKGRLKWGEMEQICLGKCERKRFWREFPPIFYLKTLISFPTIFPLIKFPPLEGGEYSRIYAPAWKTNKQAELSQTQFSKSLTKLELSLAKNGVN